MSIRTEHLTCKYHPNTPMETTAIADVNVEIHAGEFVGLIGHTGSGKSTLIQHLNGLLVPTEGHVYFNDEDIFQKGYDLRALRGKVGLVFQYPEHQLFMETVLGDVCFGPKNLGLSEEAAKERAEQALTAVGMPADTWEKSPFDLSGGQKRRVAIAGVLAMEPEYLILDEPTAGLDPAGRDEILGLLRGLCREKGIAIVLVSHSMEDMAEYTDRVIVMSHGSVLFDGTTREVFSHKEELEAANLAVPQVTALAGLLRAKGIDVPSDMLTVEEARGAILAAFGSRTAAERTDAGSAEGKEGMA